MTKFFATRDNKGNDIDRAEIMEFPTREEAVEYLLAAFDPDEWDHASAVIEPGGTTDCWQKIAYRDGWEDCDLSPFTLDECSFRLPGHHPGGKDVWITPLADILIVLDITPKV